MHSFWEGLIMIIFFVEFILPRSTSIFCCKKMWYCWHQFSKNVKFASFGQVLLGMVSLCATLQRHRQMMNSDEAHHFGGQLQKTSIGSLFGEGTRVCPTTRNRVLMINLTIFFSPGQCQVCLTLFPVPNTVWLIFTPILILLIRWYLHISIHWCLAWLIAGMSWCHFGLSEQ